MPPGDNGAGEVEEREVIGGLLGPTDQDGTEAVEPGVRSLDHPAARFGSGMTLGMGLFAAGAQMQGEAERRGQGTRLVIEAENLSSDDRQRGAGGCFSG